MRDAGSGLRGMARAQVVLWLVRSGLYAAGGVVAWRQWYFGNQIVAPQSRMDAAFALWRSGLHDYSNSLAMSMLTAVILILAFAVTATCSALRGHPLSPNIDVLSIIICLMWGHDALLTAASAFT